MKKYLLIFTLLLLGSSLLLHGCGSECVGGTDTGNPSCGTDEQGSNEGTDSDDDSGDDADMANEEAACVGAGGEWVEFEDVCTADLCPAQQEAIDCSPESGSSCECGENSCWNNETWECEGESTNPTLSLSNLGGTWYLDGSLNCDEGCGYDPTTIVIQPDGDFSIEWTIYQLAEYGMGYEGIIDIETFNGALVIDDDDSMHVVLSDGDTMTFSNVVLSSGGDALSAQIDWGGGWEWEKY